MKPRSVFYKNLKPDEVVVLVVRRHWFVLFRETFGLLLLFVIPFFAIPILIGVATQGGNIPVPAGIGLFFAAFWALIIWNIFFLRWTDYYYDMWIITSQRIIDINQMGLFNRDQATLFNLNHIEDVKTVLGGVFGNLLGFGTIQVQTAASKDEFVIDEVANPNYVERVIRDTQAKYHQQPTNASHHTLPNL